MALSRLNEVGYDFESEEGLNPAAVECESSD